MDAAHFVFAGGGTGGHLYPGIAVADALRRVRPESSIAFFTTTRELDRQLLDPTGHERVRQPVRPFSARPWDWPGFYLAWRRSVAAARERFRQRRPHAVLGLGGYAAGPAVVAARRMGIRTAILNPDAIPGRANRHLAAYADLVVMQWEASRNHFGAQVSCRALGCPIRAAFAGKIDPAEARRRFGLALDKPTLLVTGASQGARTINDALLRVWPAFQREHSNWQMLHLTGAADEQRVRAAYTAAAAPATVLSFTHEMPQALAAADLVITRAGASTLAELGALGRASILLPYPYHRDRHQHANAQVLVDAGAAVLLEDWKDAERNSAGLLEALAHLKDTAPRTAMAAAASQLGRPRAADDVAEWLIG